MTCQDSQFEEAIERYLTGNLKGPEREEFEKHYFECDRCFEAVEAARAVQTALQSVRRARAPAPIRRRWVPLVAAIAAVLLIGLSVVLWRRPATAAYTPPPAPNRLELLARFDPPRYEAGTLRGTEAAPSPDFRTAMARYSQGDYPGAIPGLLKVESTEAHFYLGVSYLLNNNRTSGIAELRKVVAAGDTPYLEEAHFYLAKGLLGGGDVAGAREQLQDVIVMHGDLEKQAGDLAAQLK
ncbi:MAG TPA: zf-HC2 domain-containing protein [Bryobacteraceae bacterium]|nr:zf-HC2 domain-containing protein [Bryobacteraceae bacterium]